MEQSWESALQSENPQERLRGIKSLVQSNDPRAMKILKWLHSNDPDQDIRELAKKAALYLYQKNQSKEEPDQELEQPAPAPPEPEQKQSIAPSISPSPVSDSPLPTDVDEPSVHARDKEAANQKLQQALSQQMSGNQEKALKHISAALEINPTLRKDTFAMNLASSITNLPPDKAIISILQDTTPPTPLPPSRGQKSSPTTSQRPAVPISEEGYGKENQAEQRSRSQLESLLNANETLLSYCGGTLPGLFTSKQFSVGLTNQRVVLLSTKRGKSTGQTYSIWIEFIKSIQLAGLFNRLKIQVPGGTLAINPNKSYWKKRARHLSERSRTVISPGDFSQPEPNRALEQASTLEDLGLIKAGLRAIKSANLEEIPSQDDEPTILERLQNRQFSYQVTAGFLFANVLAGFLFGLLGMILGVPIASGFFFSAVIDILIGIYLWRGEIQPWAGWAILRAGAGGILYGIVYLSQGLYLDLFSQLSLSGAIILALTGTDDRLRAYTSIGIYAIGYIGIITLSILLSAFTALGG